MFAPAAMRLRQDKNVTFRPSDFACAGLHTCAQPHTFSDQSTSVPVPVPLARRDLPSIDTVGYGGLWRALACSGTGRHMFVPPQARRDCIETSTPRAACATYLLEGAPQPRQVNLKGLCRAEIIQVTQVCHGVTIAMCHSVSTGTGTATGGPRGRIPVISHHSPTLDARQDLALRNDGRRRQLRPPAAPVGWAVVRLIQEITVSFFP
jgi:hypothetical protein